MRGKGGGTEGAAAFVLSDIRTRRNGFGIRCLVSVLST